MNFIIEGNFNYNRNRKGHLDEGYYRTTDTACSLFEVHWYTIISMSVYVVFNQYIHI